MSVRYIRVNPSLNMFSPATRSNGDIAIIGDATAGPTNDAQLFTDPASAAATFTSGNLVDSIQRAFLQTPGPTIVYGVRISATTNASWQAALNEVSALNVQIVVLANTPLDGTTGDTAASPPGAIIQLANHVTTVSNTGSDGMERIGVAMLPADSTSLTRITGSLQNDRMVFIAHRSTQDAAAAVAGTVSGYEPHVSLLLKSVNIDTNFFTPAQIATINGAETSTSGPAGQGVNWFTDPTLIPGRGVYMGEGYTGDPGNMKFIDVQRTIDSISFSLKARLIRTIGSLRISRSGLRALRIQFESVLDPLISRGVIEDYDVVIPILNLLDKDPASLTASELAQINQAQTDRVVEVVAAIDYAGAIHRLSISLIFE